MYPRSQQARRLRQAPPGQKRDSPSRKLLSAISSRLPTIRELIVRGTTEFSQAVVFETPIGRWAACDRCAELIEIEDWPKLAERAVRRFVKQLPMTRDEQLDVKQQLREIHQLFREHRIRET
jgi:hypothetical protein